MEKNKFELIITIINRGHSDAVVDAARKAGASGGTIIYGRGTSLQENETILGVSLQPEKELVLTLVKSESKRKVMEAIVSGGQLFQEGEGLCFCLPVLNVAGMPHLNNIEIYGE